jgi:rare lipoprotein A
MKPHLHLLRPLRGGLHVCCLLTLFFLFTFLAGCNTGPDKGPTKADTTKVLETKTGLASFYSRQFQGQETASGETFDNAELVAAHPSYPLGTVVRVKNLENDSTVRVRINDRGPTAENRREGVIIDLSRAAARKLGMIRDGRVKVQVEVLQWGTDERK